MTTYLVRLTGRNFLVKGDEGPRKMRFYATRLVEADTPGRAETLARDFKGRIAFMGGIDTQDLLVNGTPEEIYQDVLRVKALLGPQLIISPSHEAILPNVPPENVEAMAHAAIQ